MSGFRNWDGTEWQDYCVSLLRERYKGHDLQEVPDRHQGDLGIEAFAHDGSVFQCYAAQEPLSVADLYIAQRDKLTEDVGKLQKNKERLAALLGAMLVSKYVFMVHRNHSRRLIEHARTKEALVKSWDLSFVSPQFTIVIVTDDYYATERQALASIPVHVVPISPASASDVETWSLANAPQLEGATAKLVGAGITGDALEEYLQSTVAHILEGENALSALKAKYPEQWTTIAQLKSQRERTLAIEFPAGHGMTSFKVASVADELASKITRDAPTISARLAEAIAWSCVADWLTRCPLRFEASA